MHQGRHAERLARVIIGRFFEVYNRLRYGFLEGVYVGALVEELRRLDIPCEREYPVEVLYRGVPVGFYRADLLVDGCLIVEVKAGRKLDDSARWQTLNYLRATGLPLGLVLHFGPEAHFHRVIGPSHRLRRVESRSSEEGCS
jgi:GxxExxY protein